VSIEQKLSRKQLVFSVTKRLLLRFILLCFFLLVAFLLYLLLGSLAQPQDAYVTPFLQVWMLCFLPYFGACALVFLSPSPVGRWRHAEVAVILFGALVFRVLLLPQVPWLSRDSWRYL